MTGLLITTQVAGILLLMATMILLFFRRIYLDAESKQPIKFTLPLLGEISTQAPVIVLVLVGAFMVIYPLSKMGAQMVPIEGTIDTGGKSVSVLVVAVPAYEHTQDAPGQFSMKIPLLATQDSYRVKFLVDKQVIDDQSVTLQEGRFALKPVQWSPPADTSRENSIPVKKDISDDELQALQKQSTRN
ncbi:MAG TPA: hypothetical protein VMS64_27205 [Candidatus Methylomirabilis sp.]|nr:hypothetical protein [Candidatus Methylomirabilis sp.]